MGDRSGQGQIQFHDGGVNLTANLGKAKRPDLSTFSASATGSLAIIQVCYTLSKVL